MNRKLIVLGSTVLAIGLLVSCQKLLPQPYPEDELLDGPIEGLTGEQRLVFSRGDKAFNEDIFTAQNGLGPLFVATSCGSCHAGDGKGHPFAMLTRFGQSDTLNGNLFLHAGGPQLQHLAVPGFSPETIPAGATSARFLAPANTGLGLLDAVPDALILSHADPDDANQDGISGRPNWVLMPSYTSPRPGTIERIGRYIGRFGKKGAAYDLLQQTAGAYNQDIGITSSFEPVDTYTSMPIDPEVSNQTVLDVVFYLKTLKAPIQRNADNPDIKSGKQVFTTISCGKCHVPDLQTGYSSIAALSNKTISPYTDLLLHDMGAGLNDGYTEGKAMPAEWKTPALWGLGLSKKSQGGQYFLLHDGRARSIEEAIMLHGGEAVQSKNQFQQLNAAEKQKLLAFLESL